MAFTLTQSKISGATAANLNTVYDATPTTGALLLASVRNNSGTTAPTVSDSNGNWTNLASKTSTGGRSVFLFGLIAVASQPKTINVVRSTDTLNMNLYEFAGGPATITGIVDQNNGTTGVSASTTNGSQPTITSTVTPGLIFTTFTPGGGVITSPSLSDATFTAGLAAPAGGIRMVDYWKSGTAGTYNPYFSWTTDRTSLQMITSLKGAAGGTTFGLLGVL